MPDLDTIAHHIQIFVNLILLAAAVVFVMAFIRKWRIGRRDKNNSIQPSRERAR